MRNKLSFVQVLCPAFVTKSLMKAVDCVGKMEEKLIPKMELVFRKESVAQSIVEIFF